MIKNVSACSLPILTSLTYIALQPFGVFDLSLTSLTFLRYIALQPSGVFDLGVFEYSKNIRITSPTSSPCHIPVSLFELQCRL